jgi:hypothetical protein
LHRLLRNVFAAREGKMSPGGIGSSIDEEAVENSHNATFCHCAQRLAWLPMLEPA